MKRLLLLLIILLLLLSCAPADLQNESLPLYTGEISQEGASLLFLSVGQGDCCLISLPTGERLLIDTGPNLSRNHVTKQLTALGVDRIDYLFLTHGHEDHAGNLLTLARRFHVRGIYYGGSAENYGKPLVKARRRGVFCREVAAGEVFTFGEAKLWTLSPAPNQAYENLNDGSLILRLSYGDSAALFMADGTWQTEAYLLFTYPRSFLQADVLKVGHHGSAFSSGSSFLHVAEPSLAVISVGENGYGHPTWETLSRLGELPCRILRTDEDGAIQIVLDGGEARVVE